MIIRITVHDNDYSPILESLAKTFRNGGLYTIGRCKDCTKVDFSEYVKNKESWEKVMNPNYRKDEITPDDMSRSSKLLYEHVENFLKNWFIAPEDQDESAYVRSDLLVDIVDTYESKWENGEVLYYFLRGDVYLVQ